MDIIHQRKYDSRDVISYSNLMGLELELIDRDNEFDSTKRMGLKECCDVTADVESRGHIWAALKAAFSSKLGLSNRSRKYCSYSSSLESTRQTSNYDSSIISHVNSGRIFHVAWFTYDFIMASWFWFFLAKTKTGRLKHQNYQFTLNALFGRTFTWFRDFLI